VQSVAEAQANPATAAAIIESAFMTVRKLANRTKPELRARNTDNRTQFVATWLLESGRERRAGEGSRTFQRRIQPLLLELATDRLVHRHGVNPELEPERARAITGDRLWLLMTDDDKRTASLDEIEYAIHTIENL